MLRSRALWAALGAFAAALVFSFVVADATHPTAIFPKYLLAAVVFSHHEADQPRTRRAAP